MHLGSPCWRAPVFFFSHSQLAGLLVSLAAQCSMLIARHCSLLAAACLPPAPFPVLSARSAHCVHFVRCARSEHSARCNARPLHTRSPFAACQFTLTHTHTTPLLLGPHAAQSVPGRAAANEDKHTPATYLLVRASASQPLASQPASQPAIVCCRRPPPALASSRGPTGVGLLVAAVMMMMTKMMIIQSARQHKSRERESATRERAE